ncbi:MAG: MerR family transcriptional regulator [Bryobacteraceae bacterium]
MSSPSPALPPLETKIPDKLYFRIGEVASLVGVEPYVLRFWESEFPQLAPRKSGTGHRLYRRKEVEMVLEVKRLLYDRRFTIEGARIHLEQSKKKSGPAKPAPAAKPEPAPMQAALFADPAPSKVPPFIKDELGAILAMLR